MPALGQSVSAMVEFEELYHPAADVDHTLRPLLRRLHHELKRLPIDMPSLKSAILEILQFLATPAGRTDANCCAVNSFLLHNAFWDDGRLPSPYLEIIVDMGGTLHDTITAPDIASNFYSTPEQLLARAQRLD
jgi:hypothetical protein